MKAEIMLPLMAMILQAGILSRQNDMLQRQNDLISEIQTRLNERDEKLSHHARSGVLSQNDRGPLEH